METIDLGEESGPRIVVSGLVKFMKESDLLNQFVVLLCNLKPAKMRLGLGLTLGELKVKQWFFVPLLKMGRR
jgi:hypothetical protein